jgi:hypothetical protein
VTQLPHRRDHHHEIHCFGDETAARGALPVMRISLGGAAGQGSIAAWDPTIAALDDLPEPPGHPSVPGAHEDLPVGPHHPDRQPTAKRAVSAAAGDLELVRGVNLPGVWSIASFGDRPSHTPGVSSGRLEQDLVLSAT